MIRMQRFFECTHFVFEKGSLLRVTLAEETFAFDREEVETLLDLESWERKKPLAKGTEIALSGSRSSWTASATRNAGRATETYSSVAV